MLGLVNNSESESSDDAVLYYFQNYSSEIDALYFEFFSESERTEAQKKLNEILYGSLSRPELPLKSQKVGLFWNPQSGVKQSLQLKTRVLTILKHLGATIHQHETDIEQLYLKRPGSYLNKVFVIAGDNTIQEIVSCFTTKASLHHLLERMIIIPAGHANGIATSMGLTSESIAIKSALDAFKKTSQPSQQQEDFYKKILY